MTIDDVKTRYLTNRGISDPVAREADKQALISDITAEWGPDKVDLAIREAIDLIWQETRRT